MWNMPRDRGSSPSAPGAFGHFTIYDDLGNWYRFLKELQLVNGERCDPGTAQDQNTHLNGHMAFQRLQQGLGLIFGL
ncbi:hypothetical protein F8M41_000031 [Gigaspora margarita]|uniref:Uncharacterized protein n=1 Tax=Gigaspora margarita TaxID=4874 RepID=A0A8H4B6I5_GIGMA|nr:hypothetical protein F8M41_000031 [Gigaspora margarita]